MLSLFALLNAACGSHVRKNKKKKKKAVGWNIMLLVDKGEKRVSVVGILCVWSKMLSSIASTILTFINTNYLVVYQKSL